MLAISSQRMRTPKIRETQNSFRHMEKLFPIECFSQCIHSIPLKLMIVRFVVYFRRNQRYHILEPSKIIKKKSRDVHIHLLVWSMHGSLAKMIYLHEYTHVFLLLSSSYAPYIHWDRNRRVRSFAKLFS